MAKLIASTYRVNAVVTLLEGVVDAARKALVATIDNEDFEYLISWKATEMAQGNVARNLLNKINEGRKSAAQDYDAEVSDRIVVAMLIGEAWKLAMGTSIHNSTSSASNLVNESKIELGRKMLLVLGIDGYYLPEAVAAAIRDDVAPLSK